jgi:hypothetical protein
VCPGEREGRKGLSFFMSMNLLCFQTTGPLSTNNSNCRTELAEIEETSLRVKEKQNSECVAFDTFRNKHLYKMQCDSTATFPTN